MPRKTTTKREAVDGGAHMINSTGNPSSAPTGRGGSTTRGAKRRRTLNNTNSSNIYGSGTIIAANPFDDDHQSYYNHNLHHQIQPQQESQMQHANATIPSSTTLASNHEMMPPPVHVGPPLHSIQQVDYSPAPYLHPHQAQNHSHQAHLQLQQPYSTTQTIFCGNCQREVYHNEPNIICKAGCRSYYHLICSRLTQSASEMLLKESQAEWVCEKCTTSGQIPYVKYKMF